MIEGKYSAGLISQSFWFIEMKKIIKLIDEGKSEEEIKNLCISENLFGAAKEYRAKRIYGYIWNRAKKLDKTLIDLFVNSDLATQKIINLVAILRTDRLFFEFMFEVYREKNILGIPVIEESDVNIFFNNKEVQNDDIAEWTDGTKRRLRSVYFNYLTDANLLSIVDKQKTITPPILDTYSLKYRELYTKCYDEIESYSSTSVQSSMLKGIAKASTSVGKLVEKIPVISKGQADEALIAAGDKLDEINAGKVRKQMSSLIEHQSNAIRPFIENIDTVNELYNKPVRLLVDKENLYIATIA